MNDSVRTTREPRQSLRRGRAGWAWLCGIGLTLTAGGTGRLAADEPDGGAGRLLTINGRVVDAEDGRGIAGVQIRTYQFVTQQYIRHVDRAETDAEGRYRVHVPPGRSMIQPSPVPKDHLALETEECPRIEVKGDLDWPVLKLRRAAVVEGIAVDGRGRGIPGVEVFLVAPGLTAGDAMNAAPIKAGPDGSFRIEQVDPDDTLPIRARTKGAATDGPVVIRPKERKGRLAVTVEPERAFRVRGVVKDAGGRPIAGAEVSLWWNRRYNTDKAPYATMGLGSQLEVHATDDSGRFLSDALWPGDRYHVAVVAAGHNAAESPEVEGRAGQTHDFGTISLIGTGGFLAGRVVDSAGKPIAGVTVFNRGDGPEPVTMETDDQGRFRLGGLFAGGKFAFARKEGYRFTAGRSEADTDDLTIRLLRVDEPPPAWKPGASASYEEQRALARKVLSLLWDRYGRQARTTGAFVCMLHMARIDPALALKWSAEGGGRYDARIRHIAAEHVAETDAAAALELLADGGAQYIVQELAGRFLESDPQKALAFAEEAAVQARAMELPDRAGALAEAGAVLARLGRVEAGRKLIAEAAEAAGRMGVAGRQDYARGRVAGALAPFDIKKAVALIEPIKGESDRERYTAFIATAIAATDPARAVALADAMERGSSTPQTIKTAVAYRIGPGRPDEAARILEGMKGDGAEKFRAEAFGWLAVAISTGQPARARDLIDRALAMPIDQPDAFASYTYFGAGTASAAWIAACARRAGYPDMDSVIARVLAARPAGHLRDPSMEIEGAAIAAEALALTDPGAARQILRDIEARSGLGAVELNKVARHRWLSAWALADLEHAERLFEAEMAALEGLRDVDLQNTGLLKMAEVLAIPPRRREDFLRGEIGANWHPGFQH